MHCKSWKENFVSAHPNIRYEYSLATEASLTGIGATSTQKQGVDNKVVAFADKTLTKNQKNNSATKLFAVVDFSNYSNTWVGGKLAIVTDSYSSGVAVQLQNNKGLTWLEKLGPFKFEMWQNVRKDMRHGNCMSRDYKWETGIKGSLPFQGKTMQERNTISLIHGNFINSLVWWLVMMACRSECQVSVLRLTSYKTLQTPSEFIFNTKRDKQRAHRSMREELEMQLTRQRRKCRSSFYLAWRRASTCFFVLQKSRNKNSLLFTIDAKR